MTTMTYALRPSGDPFLAAVAVRVVPPIVATRAELLTLGTTLPAAPPPPGVSTALVALCAFGTLAAVLLFVRGEQLFALLWT